MDPEVGMSERRFRLLRKQLDELGYLHTLPIDALPLVERLTSDLLHTTDSLRHYKEIAQKSLEERVYLENGIEPYKQENAKLVRECNDLHIKFLKIKEEAEKQQKSLKNQIRKLQSENSDLKFLSSQHLHQAKELEKESSDKTLTILRLQNKAAQPVVIAPGGRRAPLRSRASLEIDAPLEPSKTWKDQFWSASAQTKDPYIANMVEVCDDRICALSRENTRLRRKLSDKDRELEKLHHCIQDLNYEKQSLQKRVDGKIISAVTRSSMTSPVMEGPGQSVRAVLNRCLRERDLAKGDVTRLEEERDALRERLKVATETQVTEHARLEKTIMESEDRVRRLELERRDLMSTAGVQKATINNLEDELESLREKHHGTQADLSQQRSLYSQIKSLQDQTDRALADSQGQLAQLEAELGNSKERVRILESDRSTLDREVSTLKTEQTVLRGNLAQVDQEKDALLMNIDSKTEQIVQLERQLKINDSKIVDLDGAVIELQKKLDISLDENAAREQAVRAAEREAEALRAELQTLERTRDGVLRENRRLQDDLASATQDVRQANRELEQAQDEVDTLKRQVQDYVAEIQRIEELLAQKESERSEMLEQFRGLSVEATMLESNNHSLESEAAESKHQLQCAEDRITDLEHQLEMRDSLVQSYENQIAELTASIASLETQLQQFVENRQKTDADLDALRDLCVKLDSQKDGLQQQLNKQDVVKIQWETEMSRLQDEQDLLQEHLSKDRASIASLENMLSSARQETAQQKHHNDELKAEVERLQLRVDTLQSKLDAETAELHRYQFQANEYNKQIKEFQRQITNERFERARATEENKRMSESCCPCPGKVSIQACPAITHGAPPLPAIPPGAQQSVRSGNWNRKAFAPCGRFPPCANAGDSAAGVRRKPLYMTPPPSTDWVAFKASLFPKGAPPTFTTEPPGIQPFMQSGIPCNKPMCPATAQARPTYLTGPRMISPGSPEAAPQCFYICNKPACPYGHVMRGTCIPPGVRVRVCSGGIPPGQTAPSLVEQSAGGDQSAKLYSSPVSPPDSTQKSVKPPSPRSEPTPAASGASGERRASSSEPTERSLKDTLRENTTDFKENVSLYMMPGDNQKNYADKGTLQERATEEKESGIFGSNEHLENLSVRRSYSAPDIT